jgi:hypothetical protein
VGRTGSPRGGWIPPLLLLTEQAAPQEPLPCRVYTCAQIQVILLVNRYTAALNSRSVTHLANCPSPDQRWGQPGQQQGRRFPSLRLEQPHLIRWLLVAAFFADSIQHIHSLRASGVISSHVASACGSDVRACFKSAGSWCTTPPEIFRKRGAGIACRSRSMDRSAIQ